MEYLISLYDALIGANVPSDKAAAVVQAMEREHVEKLATKTDLLALDTSLRSHIQAELRALELRLTLRLGAMLAASVGVTVALLKAIS